MLTSLTVRTLANGTTLATYSTPKGRAASFVPRLFTAIGEVYTWLLAHLTEGADAATQVVKAALKADEPVKLTPHHTGAPMTPRVRTALSRLSRGTTKLSSEQVAWLYAHHSDECFNARIGQDLIRVDLRKHTASRELDPAWTAASRRYRALLNEALSAGTQRAAAHRALLGTYGHTSTTEMDARELSRMADDLAGMSPADRREHLTGLIAEEVAA
jgi:hypothetical protein